MITYEYKCKDCDHRFSIKQKMTDEPLVHCPHCNKPELKKVISGGGGFTLSGGGWSSGGRHG